MIKENIKNNTIKPVSGIGQWYIIDAKDKILGRLSTFLAIRLMGKHKASYSDNECIKDKIVVINAQKIVFSGCGIISTRYRVLGGGWKTLDMQGRCNEYDQNGIHFRTGSPTDPEKSDPLPWYSAA